NGKTMAETKVIMPQMGDSIFEGTITKWLKKKGERVERDEPLFEISTDKIDTEIPSPAAGVLQDILVKEGQTVQINTVVAVIVDGSAKPTPTEDKSKEARKQPPKQAKEPTAQKEPPKDVKGPAPVAGPTREVREEERRQGGTQQPPSPQPRRPEPEQPQEPQGIRSSPLVRRIAKENRIELNNLAGKGTGINGRITKSDILSYIEQGGRSERETQAPLRVSTPAKTAAPSAPPITFTGPVERVPLTAMRKSIAEHMVMSRRTSAHVTTFFEVDCSRILKAKEKLQPEFEHNGVRLTVTPFFMQAAATALKHF